MHASACRDPFFLLAFASACIKLPHGAHRCARGSSSARVCARVIARAWLRGQVLQSQMQCMCTAVRVLAVTRLRTTRLPAGVEVNAVACACAGSSLSSYAQACARSHLYAAHRARRHILASSTLASSARFSARQPRIPQLSAWAAGRGRGAARLCRARAADAGAEERALHRVVVDRTRAAVGAVRGHPPVRRKGALVRGGRGEAHGRVCECSELRASDGSSLSRSTTAINPNLTLEQERDAQGDVMAMEKKDQE
eukprot:1582184-Pleurochrysis_carterae.AAC.3